MFPFFLYHGIQAQNRGGPEDGHSSTNTSLPGTMLLGGPGDGHASAAYSFTTPISAGGIADGVSSTTFTFTQPWMRGGAADGHGSATLTIPSILARGGAGDGSGVAQLTLFGATSLGGAADGFAAASFTLSSPLARGGGNDGHASTSFTPTIVTPLTVVTDDIASIQETGAVSGGNVFGDGASSATSRGIVWGMISGPTVDTNDGMTTDGSGSGAFTSTISGLNCNTLYFVRAYAVIGGTPLYGAEKSFTTLPDATPPTVLCKAVTLVLNASGTATLAASQVDDGSSDACGIASMSVVPSSFTCANLGINTVTLTVTDHNANAASCTATITVVDNNPPVASCKDFTASIGSNGTVNITPDDIDDGSSDNCSVTRSLSQSSFTCADVGPNTVTLTVTDPASNSATCDATVTIVDDLPPVVLCDDITVYLDSNGAAAITVDDVDAGSYDNCAIATRSLDVSSFSCADVGPNAVTLHITDVNGNSASCVATVTVKDAIDPVITAPADIVVNSDAGLCTGSGIDLGTPAVSDNCGTTVTNDAPAVFPTGVTTVTWTVTDPSGNTATATQKVTVEKVITVATVAVAPSTQQYSDEITFTATISPGSCGSAGVAATSVTFYVGTQAMGTVPLTLSGGDLTASLTAPLLEPVPFGYSPTGQMEPGTHTVEAVIHNVDPDFVVVDPTTTLTIEEEDAEAIYTGVPFVSTPGVSSYTATIPLAATIVDHDDGDRGEIRNARVTFRMEDPVSGTILGSSPLQPVLVNPTNTTVGTVASYGSYTLSGSELNKKGTSLLVYTVTDHYYRNILVSGEPDYDAQVITVSLPGTEAVTGGGFLVMQSSAGYWAGTTGKKMNFGFTMKYNPSGKNLKGQANIIFRAKDSIYQIKSNAINTMAVNSSTNEAYFNTKANLKNVTDPANPISLGGNLDLTVAMRDVSSSGQNDEISIHLARQNGQVLFSSHWSSNQTVRRQLNPPNGNGNIRVRSNTIPRRTLPSELSAPDGFSLFQNYPNPFNPTTTIAFTIPEEGMVRLAVYDFFGRQVETLTDEYLTPGVYYTRFHGGRHQSGTYIYQLEWNGHIKMRKMTLVK